MPWNDVHVQVEHGLAGCRADVHTDVVAVWRAGLLDRFQGGIDSSQQVSRRVQDLFASSH